VGVVPARTPVGVGPATVGAPLGEVEGRAAAVVAVGPPLVLGAGLLLRTVVGVMLAAPVGFAAAVVAAVVGAAGMLPRVVAVAVARPPSGPTVAPVSATYDAAAPIGQRISSRMIRTIPAGFRRMEVPFKGGRRQTAVGREVSRSDGR
jgi:hypothetical protein